MQSTEFHRNKKPSKKLLQSCCVLIFLSPSKGYQQGYKWFCRATKSSLGILNSLNTNVKVHYINYMARSLCNKLLCMVYMVECRLRNLCCRAALTCQHHRFVAPLFVSVTSCFGRADLANCCGCLVKVRLM